MESKKFFWMIKKDLLTMWRNKIRLFSLIIFPIIMIALCGWGMGGSVENVPVVVVKQTDGDLTDQTIDAIKSDKTFQIVDVLEDPNEGKQMVENEDVKAAIILPKDYEETDSAKNAMLYIDSSDQTTTSVLVPTTQSVFAKISEQVSLSQVESANSNQSTGIIDSAIQGVNLQVNRIYGNIDYTDFLLPGVLAMTLYMSSMMTMGSSIAGERERGELTRLFMTPTSISTVLSGKIISQLIIEFIRAVVLIISAVLLFSVIIKGSLLLLLVMLIISMLCFVGFGMLFSATAKTQEDYMQMTMPITMPAMFVSGIFFPVETMPWVLQKLSVILPTTYASHALRTIMLQGAGWGDVYMDIIALLIFTVIFFVVGIKRFNRDI